MRRVLVPAELAPPVLSRERRVVRRLAGESMGTSWSVLLSLGADRAVAPIAHAVQFALDRVVAQMSGWEPESDLCRFNRAAAGTWCHAPAEMWLVIEQALSIAQASAGAFDPTLGALVDLWGFGPGGRRSALPSAAEIAAAQVRSGWQHLQLDPARQALLQPGGLQLDLSGIAKGFAVDLVAARLRAAGIGDFLVELGGELRGEGTKPDGTPWWVALEEPEASDGIETVVALHGQSVATSGDYRRFFEADGRRHAHTIDLASGTPVSNGVASVAVLHPSCLQADALATALTVMGVASGLAFAERHGIAARFTRRARTRLVETTTSAFDRMAR